MNSLTSLDREVLRIMMIDAIGHDPKTWVSSHEYDIGVDGNIDANRLIDVTAKFFEAKANDETINTFTENYISDDRREYILEKIKHHGIEVYTTFSIYSADLDIVAIGKENRNAVEAILKEAPLDAY